MPKASSTPSGPVKLTCAIPSPPPKVLSSVPSAL
jgi:hypothetical protein